MLETVSQRLTGIETDTRTDSQDRVWSGTDLDPSADKEWLEDGKHEVESSNQISLLKK